MIQTYVCVILWGCVISYIRRNTKQGAQYRAKRVSSYIIEATLL